VADNDDPKKTRAYKKQDAENQSADPDNVGQALGALSSQLGAFLDEIKADRTANEGEHRTDRKWQRIIAGIGTLIAFFTLLVLIKTYAVYNKILTTENTQATIMATQATIMEGQKEITGKTLPAMQAQAQVAQGELDEVRLADRPVIGESRPATIVPYTMQVCSGKTFPGPPIECHTENGRTIEVCFKNVGKAGARVIITGHNLAAMAPAVPSSEFDVAKFGDCKIEYFVGEDQFTHRGVSTASLGPFVLFSGDERCYTSWPGILDQKKTLANFNAGRGTYFVGCVDYEDALHAHYQLQVCRYFDVRSNTVKTCPAYDYESEYKPEDNPFPEAGRPTATPTK